MTDVPGRTTHWMTEDLLPLCNGPADEDGHTLLTPVLTNVTCPECIEVLTHA